MKEKTVVIKIEIETAVNIAILVKMADGNQVKPENQVETVNLVEIIRTKIPRTHKMTRMRRKETLREMNGEKRGGRNLDVTAEKRKNQRRKQKKLLMR